MQINQDRPALLRGVGGCTLGRVDIQDAKTRSGIVRNIFLDAQVGLAPELRIFCGEGKSSGSFVERVLRENSSKPIKQLKKEWLFYENNFSWLRRYG